MGDAAIRFFSPNLVTICVVDIKEGDFSGELWHQYATRPVTFRGAMELLFRMEDLFDEWNFPQRSTQCRSFKQLPEKQDRTPNFKRGKKMNLHNVQDKRGKQGTFIVQVQYRQNSSWQGQVIWAEENKREHFRSALELMKLMDSALSEEADIAADEETKAS